MNGLTSGSFSRLQHQNSSTETVSSSLRLAARSHIGHVRRENQDDFYADPQGRFMIVADGMGGHNGGAVASRIATKAAATILDHKRTQLNDMASNIMLQAFSSANRAVISEGIRKPRLSRMGTTMVCAILDDDKNLFIGNVGDSRMYRFRAHQLECITEDHTLLVELMNQKLITHEQALRNPHLGHTLTRSVGLNRGRPDVIKLDTLAGDRFLMATDGLHGVVSDNQIAEVLENTSSVTEACNLLTECALEAGAPDNVSIIIFELQP